MKKIKQIIKTKIIELYDKRVRNQMKKGEVQSYKDSQKRGVYSIANINNEQIKETENLYKENYGEEIDLTWHKHYTSFTNKFDKYYFPEILFIPEFEYIMNSNKEYCKVMEDKNILPIFAEYAKIKMPKTIVSCQEGLYKNANNEIIGKEEVVKILENYGYCFAKPSIDSCSGQGCMLLNIHDNIDQNSKKSTQQVIDELGENFIIQEQIKCHESIRKIYEGSVNTFRIMTYRWKDKIKAAPAIMRIGRNGSVVDNAHAGGIFIAINNDGTLHKTAFTQFNDQYTVHPNSKTVFEGYKIEGFSNTIDAVKKLHAIVPNIGVINWDMTIDEDGNPVLIEANINGGGIWVFQEAHGKGPFGEDTEEILQWLKFMKNVKYADRKKYLFGKKR